MQFPSLRALVTSIRGARAQRPPSSPLKPRMMATMAAPKSPEESRKALFIIGGTGLGKTKLGVQLATAVNGEVINSDAMQLYKGLPIATAQPTMEERCGVPHHLMGILGVHDAWTVRDYRDHALAVMEDIWARGKVPIVVGGTLYYVQSLIWKSLLDEQPGFEGIHQQNQLTQDSKRPRPSEQSLPVVSSPSVESPYERLKRLDPVRAAQLHPNDDRKIARSLEVLEETGKPHSEETIKHVGELDTADLRLNCRILWLTCQNESDVLDRKLKTRVESMMENGLPREAEEFIKEYGGDLEQHKKGVFQAIGFRELAEVLADPLDLSKRERCIELLTIRHRQYVKSQLKWIRNRILPRTVPVHALDATDPSGWEANVLVPALDISRRFLSVDVDLAALQKDHPVSNLVNVPVKDTKSARTCDICGGRTLVGVEQWEKHVRGRSHRKNLERHKKLERNEQERLAKLGTGSVASVSPTSPSSAADGHVRKVDEGDDHGIKDGVPDFTTTV